MKWTIVVIVVANNVIPVLMYSLIFFNSVFIADITVVTNFFTIRNINNDRLVRLWIVCGLFVTVIIKNYFLSLL